MRPRAWLWVFLCLLAYSVYAAAPTTPKKCDGIKTTKDSKMKKAQVGFYTKGMSIAMQAMIGDITQKAATAMGEIIKKPESTHKHIMGILAEYGFVLTVFIILVLLAICLLIALVAIFFVRWCKPTKEGIVPSKVAMFFTLFIIVVCATVCALGAWVFFLTIGEVKSGLKNIDREMKKTNISQFVEQYEEQMKCTLDNSNIGLESMIEGLKKDVTKEVDVLIKELQNATDKGTAAVASLGQNYVSLNDQLKKYKVSVENIKKELEESAGKAGDAIRDGQQMMKDVVAKVKTGFKEMEQQLMSVVKDNHYYSGPVAEVLRWSFIIPLVLCGIMAFGFGVLLVRFFFICSSRKDRCSHKNPVMFIARHVLGITGYVAMFIGIFFFAAAAACFLISFASMFLCIGFFDDPDLLVFDSFSALKANASNEFSLHDAFVRCKNDYPFFDAIDGDKQLAGDKLENLKNEILEKDFSGEFRTFEVSKIVLNSLRQMAQQGSETVKQYEELLQNLASRTYRDEMTLKIDDSLELLISKMENKVAAQMKEVMDMSPQCEAMMKIWDQAGSLICNGLSMPSQGTWMACVICGIGSFAVFHFMFKSTQYLMDTTGIDSEKERKKKRSVETEQTEEEEDESHQKKKKKKKKKERKAKKSGSREALMKQSASSKKKKQQKK